MLEYMFQNYPKFPISDYATYQVASLKGCRIKGKENDQFTVQFQVYYPCVVSSTTNNVNELPSLNYMRPNAVEGFCRSFGNTCLLRLGLDAVMKNKLATHLIDGLEDSVSVLLRPEVSGKDEKTLEKKWPTVIFSHGLFGSMELYSIICREIASYGFVVVAPEHEDGSASYAEKAASHELNSDMNRKSNQIHVTIDNEAARTSEGRDEYFQSHVIPYQNGLDQKGLVYREKESVVNFRRPFLRKRCEELRYLITALAQLASDQDNAESYSDTDCGITEDFMSFEKTCLSKVLLTTNLKCPDLKSVILAGHSFGGSTVLSMAHQINMEDATNMIKDVKIESLLLLDAWVSPVPDEMLSRRITIPTMTIFCEVNVMWNPHKVPHELNGIEKLLQGNHNTIEDDEKKEVYQCVAIRGTAHQFYSDVPYWIPERMARYGGASGKTDLSTSRLCLEKLVAQFLLKNESPPELELTNEERKYVFKVNPEMLIPPKP